MADNKYAGTKYNFYDFRLSEGFGNGIVSVLLCLYAVAMKIRRCKKDSYFNRYKSR